MGGMSVVEMIGSVIMLTGSLVFALAGLGVLRLRDVYSRASALTTAAGMGMSLLLIGIFCWIPDWGNAFKLSAAVLLQLLTSAVGSIAVARAAYLTGSKLYIGGQHVRAVIIREPKPGVQQGAAEPPEPS